MNANYIARALCYHGQPMQKIWEDERSVEDLRNLGLTQPSYSVYQERQKYFTFQERAKRLKIHQFLARKAVNLYDKRLVANVMEDAVLAQGQQCIAPQAPYEYFLNVKDKGNAWRYRMNALKPGYIILASVTKVMRMSSIIVKPLCTVEPLNHYLADIPIKATIFQEFWGPMPLDKLGNTRTFEPNAYIRCEIYEVSADAERLKLGMIRMYSSTDSTPLGLCELNEFPKYYRQIHGLSQDLHYEDQLLAAPEFLNPNYDVLFQLNGLQPHETLTMMSHIKAGLPEQEYAPELRQKQASQWAFRSVADGIEHFKNGQQVEAFQCLNKALHIDPRNVEGLVARGALYANRGSFLKAIEDFEKALKLNKYHVNARKYMGETLVALGRSYEEENRLPEAIKAYSDCLNLLPQHEQARQSLDALQLPQQQLTQLYGDLLKLPAAAAATTSIHVLSSEDEDSSSSDSDSGSERSSAQSHNKQRRSCSYSQPFYAMEQQAVSEAHKANEFKLDDDETMSSVRKLLREASKHKKAKKKSKKRKDTDKPKKSKKQSDIDTVEMLKKINFNEAYRLMSSAQNEAQLKASLQSYMAETQQPKSYGDLLGPSTSKYAAAFAAGSNNEEQEQPPPAPKLNEQQKLSFQIKKVDKFGMVRLATPLSKQPSSSHSRSRSPSRRSSEQRQRFGRHTRSRTPHSSARQERRLRRSRTRSRSRSPPPRHGFRYGRGGNRYDNSFRRGRRSRSRSFGRRRSPMPFQARRRTPSPFVPRRSARRSRSMSRSRSGSRSPPRQPYQPRVRGRGRYNWFRNDHADSNGQRSKQREATPTAEDPTIEQIDEMIKEAQKERKQGIIKSDKNLLKKKTPEHK